MCLCVLLLLCVENKQKVKRVCVEQNNKNGIFGETQQNKHTLNKCINQTIDISRTNSLTQVRFSTSVTCVYTNVLQQ